MTHLLPNPLQVRPSAGCPRTRDTLLRAAHGGAQQTVVPGGTRVQLLSGSEHEYQPTSAADDATPVYGFSSLVAGSRPGATTGEFDRAHAATGSAISLAKGVRRVLARGRSESHSPR